MLELLYALHHPRGPLVERSTPVSSARACTVPLPDSSEISSRRSAPTCGRVHVLEGARVAVHARHVHAALVGEGVGPT